MAVLYTTQCVGCKRRPRCYGFKALLALEAAYDKYDGRDQRLRDAIATAAVYLACREKEPDDER